MRIKRICTCLLIVCQVLCCAASAADMGILIKDGDFENGIDGFGITYSGRSDTSLPYIFPDSDMTSSGGGSLRFVASEALPEKESVSPQSLGFAYQGIYNTDYISVESGCSYTVSADFYTESDGVKLRFVEMDGNKAVAASPEVTLAAGTWQTETYKWVADRTTDRNRVRTVFYNIKKNDSIYIDNFAYRGEFISDSSWKADGNGTISEEAQGISYTASANSLKDYCGIHTGIDKSSLDAGKTYVLHGYIGTDMKEAALYISTDNIGNCYSEYQLTAEDSAYVTLEFDPSRCAEDEIKFSVTAAGTAEAAEGRIFFTDLKISEAESLMKIEQKNNELYVSGRLRKGNENRELTVNVTGADEFTTSSDADGGYSFTCALPEVQTRKGVFVSLSNINGYSDFGNVICGYTTVYNDSYRNSVAKSADEKTSLSEISSVLTDEVLKDIGISKIRNYRRANKDFVLNYLLDCDISTYEKLEEAVNVGSIINGLSGKRISLIAALDWYGKALKTDSVAAYKKGYQTADKKTLEALFMKCKTEINDIEDLHYVITELLVKEKAKKAINYSEIMSCAAEYADDLLLDFSDYNGLSTNNKYTVANSFAAYLKDADSFRTLQGELDRLVADVKKNGGQNTSGGGGGSSGGASGGLGYGNVEVEPIQKGNTDEKRSFNDLDDFVWAQESIYALLERGVISRSEENMFRPADNVTRAEFAKMISISFGLTGTKTESVFDDVNSDDWYFGYVTAMYENNIVNGISGNYFGANEPITRQDICTILGRIMEIGTDADISGCRLTDIDSASDYAKAAIAAMSDMGYVNGYEDGSFRPHNYSARAEAAKMIYSVSGK
ncbi:MAG: S-layer homology domain-containing protein [Monoglobaceae bacterium]